MLLHILCATCVLGILYISIAKLISCDYVAHDLKALLHVSIRKTCNIYGQVYCQLTAAGGIDKTQSAETSVQVVTPANAAYKLKLKVWLWQILTNNNVWPCDWAV